MSNITSPSFQSKTTDRLANLPWWAIFILFAATFFVYSFITNELYQEVIKKLVVQNQDFSMLKMRTKTHMVVMKNPALGALELIAILAYETIHGAGHSVKNMN